MVTAGGVPEGDGWDATVADHKRRQLLRIGQVAADLVARDGLSDVSMSKLARAVGISRATVYNYVPDVATAIRVHLRAQAEAFQARVEAAIAEESGPEAQLRRYIEEQVAYAAGAEHRAAAALLEAGAALGGEESPAAHHRRQSAVLDGILDRGVRDGVFRPTVGRARSVLVGRLLYGAHELLHGEGLTQAETVDAITGLLLDGVRQ